MLCFLPINTIALGRLPVEEIKNASGLYNLMRNLGGAIGLAVANTQMIYLTKANYARLRESFTATRYQALDMVQGVAASMEHINLPEPDLAALSQVTRMVLREAEVMTFNNLFQVIGFLFLVSLAFAPLLKKVGGEAASLIHE